MVSNTGPGKPAPIGEHSLAIGATLAQGDQGFLVRAISILFYEEGSSFRYQDGEQELPRFERLGFFAAEIREEPGKDIKDNEYTLFSVAV